MKYFVYIIYSQATDKFYIGETVDVEGRIGQHNSAFYNSSFSRNAKDWKLFWKLECKTHKQALQIENPVEFLS